MKLLRKENLKKMTDEQFMFVSDVSDKKRTARGIHNKRTHNGKGGHVKFPSDYLSRKEKNAMNGEVKTYQMNKPISYAEFKKYPNDLKITYIQNLRKRFDVPDIEIARKMGCPKSTLGLLLKNLGCSGKRRGAHRWNKDSWEKWWNGDSDELAIAVSCDDLVANMRDYVRAEAEECDSQPTEPVVESEVDGLRDANTRLLERNTQLERENEILRAKLSVFYLVFGKDMEDE